MWFITVIEKIEYDSSTDSVDFGDIATWGFYSEMKRAAAAVRSNIADMHEGGYDYAIIEECNEGIINYTGNHQWFKWNAEHEEYYEIETLNCVKKYCGFLSNM